MDERSGPGPGLQDLVVAGGGIAGLALAVAVRRAAPRAAVTLCDPRAASPGPRFRAFAVAAGSRRFLDGLGVWAAVEPKAQAVAAMTITDSRPEDLPRPVYLDFDGEAAPGEPFAHMVLEEDLRAALLGAARDLGVRLDASLVTGFKAGAGTMSLSLDHDVVRTPVPTPRPHAPGAPPPLTRLLVAADGARSRLREAAGIATVGWDYAQAGLVATVSHEVPHEGRAIQHFLPGGPLAILPLRAGDGTERRFSLAWSLDAAEARRLAALPPAPFLARLEEIIGHELGTLGLEDGPSAHPLRLRLPRRLVGPRFALLGDAARTIHPLAGQGLNLGLRDAAVLAELVTGRLALGLDPGDEATLAAYQRARRLDGVLMAAATDGLNRLFSNDSVPARLLRDLGLGLVDRMPGLKRFLVRDAAGLAGSVPRAFSGGVADTEPGRRR